MEKEWTYNGTKKKKAWSIGIVSGMSKLRRYITGGMIGMCFEYVYRVDSEVWYLPLSIGILMSIAMTVDVMTDYR
jgi:hypothetical protein